MANKSSTKYDESGWDQRRCARILFYVYNALFVVLGMGCFAVGIWMAADPNINAYLKIMTRYPGDTALLAAVGLFIAAGIIIIGVAVLGFFAIRRKDKKMLAGYAGALLLILILELTAGFVVVVFKDQIHMYVKSGMTYQIQEYYLWDNEIGYAWNRVQVRSRCCGADGSWNYQYSVWWYLQNPGAEIVEDGTTHVPDTCCKLEPNQDRDVTRVDPQKAIPMDKKKCNEDAEGRMDGSNYLNGRGCFAATLDFIYTHIDLIIGIGLAIGLLQLLGLLCAVLLYKTLDDDEDTDPLQKKSAY